MINKIIKKLIKKIYIFFDWWYKQMGYTRDYNKDNDDIQKWL